MPDTQPDAGLPDGFPDASRAQVYDDALDLVGNTPLVRINRLAPESKAEIWIKLDQYNLGGSSKDRIGINIVREAIASESSPASAVFRASSAVSIAVLSAAETLSP